MEYRYEKLLEKLKQWQEDELLFKEYYDMEKTQENIHAFYEKHRADSYNTSIVMHPDILPSDHEESRFLLDSQNVALVKHPRYCPFWYHKHAYFEMIYVIYGKCNQKYPDGQEAKLTAGDICLLSPKVTHGIAVFDDSLVINILIRYSTFLDIFMNTIRDKSQISLFFMENIFSVKKTPYLIFHTKGDELIRNYLFDMYLEQLQEDEFSDRIICSLLTIFFTQLTRRHKNDIEVPYSGRAKGEYDDLLLTYMLNHYSTVTLSELSEKFHYSVPYCSKLIKEISGHTFSELLTSIRLQHGESFLLSTQLSVAEISDRLGYKNPETFIRVFQRYHHMSPSQYRRQNDL
ncbi:MAG TPA: AraC family transcriptional regulator [Candidatus Blautia faecavium]|uniref:AraC family transcriptional regulator n=1 Tax=Candidatus Blautia faecavium TaxID=2838487 RepID=A0A9D2LVN9_9FIRM|nr:AraC family transcriptional regulator [Candidatus Blautia faecavium]